MKKRVVAVSAVVAVFALAAGQDSNEPKPDLSQKPLFDVMTGAAWTPAASMAIARQQHAAVTGADGRVFVFEGMNEITWVDGSEVYDPAAGSWGPFTSPGVWCCGGAARGGDGRFYLVGGENSSGPTAGVKAYDPATNSWSSVAPLSISRDLVAVVAGADGRVFAMGGAEDGDSRRILGTVEVYDPAAGSWSHAAPMGTRRWYHAAATAPDGRIFVFGGFTGGFTSIATAEVYDPATDTWSPIADMPETRYAHSAVAGGDGLLYIMGGIVNDGGDGRAVITYDPVANTYGTAPSMTAGRSQMGATLGLDGRIFATGGGVPNGGVNRSVETFATVAAPTPTNRAPIALAGDDQSLQCVAGVANVNLDGSGSSDPDGDPLTFEWREGTALIATGATAQVQLGQGSHDLSLRVFDDEHAAGEDGVVITVSDNQKPSVNVHRFDGVLWPRDDRLHLVARVKGKDGCSRANVKVTVTSNQQPKKDRGGRPEQDWVVYADRWGGYDVFVRAELENPRADRTYSIKAVATDAAGNSASASTSVLVPRSKPRGWGR